MVRGSRSDEITAFGSDLRRVRLSAGFERHAITKCDDPRCVEVYVYDGSEIKTADTMWLWCSTYVQTHFGPIIGSQTLKRRLRTPRSQAGGRCAPRADACRRRLGFYN
jgi:hypothetical protein